MFGAGQKHRRGLQLKQPESVMLCQCDPMPMLYTRKDVHVSSLSLNLAFFPRLCPSCRSLLHGLFALFVPPFSLMSARKSHTHSSVLEQTFVLACTLCTCVHEGMLFYSTAMFLTRHHLGFLFTGDKNVAVSNEASHRGGRSRLLPYIRWGTWIR